MDDDTRRGDDRAPRFDAGIALIALMGLLMAAQAAWVVVL